MPAVTMSRYTGTTKQNINGIEVVDGVVWQGWEPGQEYTKNITLKNVQVKTQKLKFNVPKSRFFSTLYPKPIVLSAGTSFTLPVTFRPLEKSVYEDKIQFRTQEGEFEVPIKAELPKFNIQVPEKLDFKMCAAKDFVEMVFEVFNSGDTDTTIKWEVISPFTIEPSEADLKYKSSCKFKATFRPEAATVYKGEAICKYGPNSSFDKTTNIKGIGKYPHILVSASGKPVNNLKQENLESIINFGTVAVGSSVQKWMELHNLSPVRVPFQVEHQQHANSIDKVFNCLMKNGIVPPMTAVRIPMMYTPSLVDTSNIDYFTVSAVGNISQSLVKCVGMSKGPIVQLSFRAVNFMQIDLGQTATKSVEVINNSDVEAVYQFMIESEDSVFKFQQVAGVLKPKTKDTIILKFCPPYPINYYRRITCLVHNQGPLFLDLLGTCHSETVKPAVLLSKHIDRYKVHAERGFSFYAPEQLNELIQEGKLLPDKDGYLQKTDSETLEVKDNSSCSSQPMDYYFNDGFHSDVMTTVPHVSCDINVADFGNCQSLRTVEDKTVNITNHTRGKVTVQWIENSGVQFSVHPTTLDIPPLKTCSFRVSFKPGAPNQFYGEELECYVYYKSLRDYRLVQDITHCPPWCLTLTCTGHTFMPHHETFWPRYTLDNPKVVFNAVNTQESTYRTILMTNTGTTPIFLDMESDPDNIFAVKPRKGLFKGKYQILTVKATPTETKIYKQDLTLRLNDNEKYNQVIELNGSAESAEVLLDTDGTMFFKPTCVGTSSKKSYGIKNVSRIPLRFEWKLNHVDAKLLKVHPDCGIIQPNEYQSQVWSFIPTTENKFVMKPNLIVWGQGLTDNSSGGMKKQFKVRAIGEGAVGELKVNENHYDLGDIVVGSSASQHLTIYNNSNCSLHFRLLVNQNFETPHAMDAVRGDKIGLELENGEGVIPARSKHCVLATVRPIRRVEYQYTISYQLLTPQGGETESQQPKHLCHILATGVFPLMAVTDARCYGSAVGISKKQLWNLFSLDTMNVCLDSDPSAPELMYTMATRHSHNRRPPVYTRAIMDFNFGAAPLKSEPCIVNLMFENTGTVPSEWAFLFPSDLRLELEYWAETGEYDEDELHEMKVMDNKLFTIEPKRGHLQPGECQTVTFTYQHTMAGTDRLPVLLKLAQGRELLLNFIGVTVEPDRKYIHFPSNKHMFTPVPVGEKVSPIQIYELYNGGAVSVNYEFDLTSLALLQQENFDQPIFECLNPLGEILPGRYVSIEWRFSPLEAKTYMVDVPIRVCGGETAIVTFTGVGYDKRVMGDTMPITEQQDLTGVPSIQSVPVPGQLAYLSQERITFGNAPLFSRSRRIVFVMNKSKEKSIFFEWHVTSPSDSQFLSIFPLKGYLEAGESQMCRVSFLASNTPSFYDLDLICQITDEHEMKKYRKKLADWEKELERQKNEFTITENDLDADKRLLDSPHTKNVVSDRATPDGEISKYKTLPPIQKKTSDVMYRSERRQRKKEKELWAKPVCPPPFLLHLGVTSRTHGILDFQNNFPHDYKKFHIDRVISKKCKQEKKNDDVIEKIECSQGEAGVIQGVMCNVLRGLLDDAYFVEAIKKVIKEPIPYFRQFGDRPSTARTQASDQHKTDIIVEDITSSTPDEGERTLSQTSQHSQDVESASAASSIHSPEPVKTPESETGLTKATDSTDLQNKQKQTLKKLPQVGNMLESVLENSLFNIMSEALAQEFNITARPRYIALPKRPNSSNNRSNKI
ncbi:cilia- and flagella-associated protein 65 [Patella vulgata]|uniref:cilia- and flagella-associated protein 65 n=1 Tax=Patella vulgata TaxID=6465 RepID=UPI00217F9D4D|nr:cilia- and flagella-associated protein 65 [Patella vulgata]